MKKATARMITLSRDDVVEFTQVDALAEVTVKSVCFGVSHTVALTDDGKVFTWGSGRGGALGRGCLEDELTPAQVTGELSNTKYDVRGLPVVTIRKVKAIAAAEDYTLVLIQDGKLFCWGNAAGVLVPTPELEGELDGRRVVKLFTNSYAASLHRAVITEEEAVLVTTADGHEEEKPLHRLFTWGRGAEGQLGHGD